MSSTEGSEGGEAHLPEQPAAPGEGAFPASAEEPTGQLGDTAQVPLEGSPTPEGAPALEGPPVPEGAPTAEYAATPQGGPGEQVPPGGMPYGSWPWTPVGPPPPGAWGSGAPPWGWSPQWAYAGPPPPPPAPRGASDRPRAPWSVILGVAAGLAAVGLGIGIGYGVWGTNPASAANSRTRAPFSFQGPFGRQAPGNTQTAFLGVELGTPSTSSGTSSPTGAYVVGVEATTPAAKAGITKGDTITALGTTTITSDLTLQAAVASHSPGQKVKVSWTTSTGKTQTATVTLTSRPSTGTPQG